VFAVEGRAAGLLPGERSRTLGLRTASYGPLRLEDVRVPAANRLGLDAPAPGALRRALRRAIARKKVLDAAHLVGCARGTSEYAFKYAQERRAFGVFLYEHQGLAFLMADMATKVDGMRTLVWEAAAAHDQGGDALPLALSAHRQAAELAVEVASDAVQVLGGHGYIADHPVEKWMRDARTLSLVDGLVFEDEDAGALLLEA